MTVKKSCVIHGGLFLYFADGTVDRAIMGDSLHDFLERLICCSHY